MKSRNRQLRAESLEERRLLAFNVSGDEQEFVQLVNRFRTDPAGEYARLEPLFDTEDFAADLSNSLWTVNRSALQAELNSLSPVAPLALSEGLIGVAEANNAQMNSNGEQGHFQNGAARREGLISEGYAAADIATTSQNVFGYGRTVIHSYANAMIDWGPGTDGMLDGRPHRVNLINAEQNLVGIDVTTKAQRFGQDFDDTRPVINTQNFAYVRDLGAFVTGAVFDDTNGSGWYESGEGIGNVRLVFTDQAGTSYATTGLVSGGYQLQLPAGTYSAVASGGGLASSQFMPQVVVGDQNVWLNWIYDANATPPNPPVAMADRASTDTNTEVQIDVLRNDMNPGAGDLTVQLVGADSAFSVDNNQLRYSAPSGFTGVHRINYTLTDGVGQQSGEATVSVFVADFSSTSPWQNSQNSNDINDDGSVSAQDALLVINAINSSSQPELPTDASQVNQYFGFLDSNGDGFLTAVDALRVINALNSSANGEAETAVYFELDSLRRKR